MKAQQQHAVLVGAVRRWGVKHPEIGDLATRLIEEDLAVSASWVERYHACAAPYGRRSLLLRAALADPSAGVAREAAFLSTPVVDRLVAWWEANASLDGRAETKELTPKAIARMADVARDQFAPLVSALCVAPWWAGISGTEIEGPCPAAGEGALRMVRRRALTAASASVLAQELRTVRGPWFFDTGAPALDLANALIYLAALLDGDREGGRAQNRLPVALTERWKLRRLSLPDALLFADAVSMVVDGMVKMPVDEDWMGVSEAARHLDAFRGLSAEHAASLDGALESHRRRWLLSPERARGLGETRAQRLKVGQYDNGLLFNLAHVLNHDAHARFVGYFAHVDGAAWIARSSATWAAADPGIAGTVQAALEAGLTANVQSRAVGNILAFLAIEGAADDEDAAELLPPVARAALGSPMPTPTTGHGGARRGTDGRRVGARRKGRPLPLLEALRRLEPRVAYLVVPGYLGPLPAGALFVPGCLAAGVELPEGVEVVGPVRVGWQEDPCVAAAGELRARGHRVVVLR